MKSIRVTFSNAAGETLAGVLDTPLVPPRHYAVFAHCFTCGKNLKTSRNISRVLTKAGFAVLRFDFTGIGQSEGDFADTNFSSNAEDLIAAARFLQATYEAPELLVGHSLGGTAALRAAMQIDSVRAVATVGSPAEPAHVRHLFKRSHGELEARGEAEVDIGGRTFTIRRQFLEDIEGHDLGAELGSLGKALLVMHSPIDATVAIDQASKLFLAARHPKSFVTLDDADHLLSRSEDSRYAAEVIAAWATRYLSAHSAPAGLEATEGAVVSRTRADGFFTEIAAGPHALAADEPRSVGGSDSGPTPYDLLAAALASCTSMTLRMYAEHKKLPLDAATVTVRHDKIHARDCADCESTEGKIDEFVREITLAGELDESQRRRMLEIADRCPVHRTLHGEVKVRSQLSEG